MRLGERIALVTGGGSGIGRAICLAMAQEGARVVVTDLVEEAAHRVAAEVREHKGVAFAYRMDVSEYEQVRSVFQRVAAEIGALDILVNNAGIAGGGGPTRELSHESWHRMLAVHLTGTFYCTQEALKLMEPRGWGRIINIASIAGITGIAGSAHYSAAKAGIIGFTKAVAREVAPRGIRVNAIAPGYIETPLLRGMREDPERYQRVVSRNLLGRLGRPEEVASLAVYLATEEADFFVGQVLSPNGGEVV
jgi:3-oxoacyl-[acyl-carrier protein] reductase